MDGVYSYEPPPLDVKVTNLAVGLGFRFYYRGFVGGLGIKPGDRVLDYCSGCGVIAAEAARMLKNGGRLVYSDFSDTWLACAGNRLKGLTVAQPERLRGFDGPIAGGGYDRIIVHFVIHDFPNAYRPLILRQLVENLKPGGIMTIREPMVKSGHGMEPEDLRGLLSGLDGLDATLTTDRKPLLGGYTDAVCRRNG